MDNNYTCKSIIEVLTKCKVSKRLGFYFNRKKLPFLLFYLYYYFRLFTANCITDVVVYTLRVDVYRIQHQHTLTQKDNSSPCLLCVISFAPFCERDATQIALCCIVKSALYSN